MLFRHKEKEIKSNARQESVKIFGGQEANLYPQSIQTAKPKKKGSQLVFGRVKMVDKMMFAKHLTVMIRSGMPLDDALDTLREQASPVFAKKIEVILEEVKKEIYYQRLWVNFPKFLIKCLSTW